MYGLAWPRCARLATLVRLHLRNPKFDEAIHPMHKELLDQGKTLRQSGKSDWEIEMILNKLLDEKWQSRQEAAQGGLDENMKPPRITVDEVRSYLQRQVQNDSANTKSGRQSVVISGMR